MLDSDGKVPLNIFNYNHLEDLIGKKLKVNIELKKARDIPDNLCNDTKCSYNWVNDQEKTLCESIVCEEKTTQPVWNYSKEHIIEIDDETIEYLKENTLTIGVYGKADSKKHINTEGDQGKTPGT